jgi:transposase-like protein
VDGAGQLRNFVSIPAILRSAVGFGRGRRALSVYALEPSVPKTSPGVWPLRREALVQILHPFSGSLQQYEEAIADVHRYRPDHCPQCQSGQRMVGHGFYRRTLVDAGFEGSIRVRRYLCLACQRTVSLLPEFALPYLRFSVSVIALFLIARLLEGRTLIAAAVAASQPQMPYQRGQFWVRRFRRQAEALGAALAAKITPLPAADFVTRALCMLQSLGWIAAHRFLFSELRVHLLAWPRFLAPHGRPATLPAAGSP